VPVLALRSSCSLRLCRRTETGPVLTGTQVCGAVPR
jgi:hypothetical protein